MKKNLFRQNKVHFTSLGCSRNLVDTEVMLGLVLKAGYEPTPHLEDADFYVINTCGFLESARQEAIDIIDSLFKTKKATAKVIVTGCMVQSHREILKEKFPEIHYYLGSGDAEKILEALSSEEAKDGVTDAKSYLQVGEVPRVLSTPKHYAYLKIAEGCKKRCSFCIIPHIKGGLKSKTVEQIKKEFSALLSQGVKEIILIAQDLGDFGKDRFEDNGLENLLKELTKIEGDYWLRLLYLYPDEITDELISIIQNEPRIVPYLDMPLQHINDRVLKAMHRKTNRAQIISIITKLREKIPNIVIRTSLMVGFPSETEEEFNELNQFIQDYPLDNIGIFQYSKENESYSALLPGHHDEETKKKRFDVLAQTQQNVLKKQSRRFLNEILEVVIEGTHLESEYLLIGRFYGQCPEIDGFVIINDWKGTPAIGQRVKVQITDVMGYDLVGKMLIEAKNETKMNQRKLSLV
jgi:ribosomal protein S12 methylthiotransferase